MHSFLIVGNNHKKIAKVSNSFAKKYGRKQLNFTVTKINDVRELNSITKLKINEPTVMIIHKLDEATTEAQNAFLKNLEEPQADLTYILIAKTTYNLVPTITSRCQLINTASRNKADKKLSNLARDFINKSTSKKLLYINSIRKRDIAINFIEELIVGLHQMLLENANPKVAFIIKGASKTLNNLKANGNVQLQLTYFVVSTTPE